MYDIRTAILPFLFIFNTQLLMIGIANWFELLLVITSAVIAMLMFAAATQGYWLVRSRLWESLALLLVAFTLFRPGFWWDMVYEPSISVDATQIEQIAEQTPPQGNLLMRVSGENIDGKLIQKTVQMPMGAAGPGRERLVNAGLETRIEDGKVLVDNIVFGSLAQDAGLDFDWQIIDLKVDADRPPKHLMFIPALLLLGFIGTIQRRRKPVPEAVAT